MNKRKILETVLKKKEIINDKVFKAAIRTFIILFLNFEKDKENNIKQNENNLINYFDILWIYGI